MILKPLVAARAVASSLKDTLPIDFRGRRLVVMVLKSSLVDQVRFPGLFALGEASLFVTNHRRRFCNNVVPFYIIYFLILILM